MFTTLWAFIYGELWYVGIYRNGFHINPTTKHHSFHNFLILFLILYHRISLEQDQTTNVIIPIMPKTNAKPIIGFPVNPCSALYLEAPAIIDKTPAIFILLV